MDLNQAIHRAANFANQGKFAKADKLCREIIAANDQFHPAFHLLGQLAAHAGRYDIAVPMLDRATALDPNRAYYHRDLAEVLIFSAKAQEALGVIKRAVILAPEDSKSHFILGLAAMSLGLFDRAVAAYQAAIKFEPNFGPAHNNLGSLLERSGDLAEAKKAYLQAITIDGNNAQAQNNLASVLIAEGDIKLAIFHLEAAIKAAPDYIEAHHNLSALKKYQKNDEHIAQVQSLARDPSKLTIDNQIRLEFVLGKIASDLENYDQAFLHYERGNSLKRATFDYDKKTAQKFHDDLKENFPETFFKKSRRVECDGPTPIFIVGMPRSGSTLVEQILVSQSDISSAGELPVLNELIKQHFDKFPKGVDKCSDAQFSDIAKQYLVALKKAAPDSKYIIDKMPGNYRLLGLIARAFPNAKIIHTMRNPMDCCLSIYTRLFLDTLHYGYDLGELGNYYMMYKELMTHWNDVLPKGMLVNISYEDVVGDLETSAKKMTDFLELDWQENLLEFHKQATNINTASAAQVRKPIYNTSIERWRVYEEHLPPLFEALGQNITVQ